MVNQALIARRAYEIWEKEGRPHGRHEEHWHKAMAELSAPAPAAGAAKARVAPARKKAAAAAPPVTVKSKKTK